MKYYSLLTLLLLSVCIAVKAQNTDAQETDPLKGKLEDQFEYVFKRSQNFQNYKVVLTSNFNHLKKSSLDTLRLYKEEVNVLESKINALTSDTDSLLKELQTRSEEIEKLKQAGEIVSFLGVNINKGLFNMIAFGGVGLLLLLLILFIMKFKSAKTQANSAVEGLSRLEEEYVDYKRKAMEKEQQLGRRLQDEINKNRKD